MSKQKLKKRILQLYLILKFSICKILSIFIKKEKDLWIFCERGTDARDNGYVMYKYVKENYPEINAKYIISKKSTDIEKIKKIDANAIIEYRSIRHMVSIINAKMLISTHIMGFAPEMNLFYHMDKIKFFKLKGKRVFLQHGIIKDKMKLYTDIDLFVSGAKPEYDFLKENYPQYSKAIKYTGLPRFDNLISNPQNIILVMPTWRIYLQNTSNFKEEEYYKRYNTLINNESLIKLLEKYNYKLIFYPHYEVQKYLSLFNSQSDKVIIASKEKYDVQKLLIESNILITDFSSVFFDFGYMNKNVVYYQFDEKKFREGHYEDGYFSYKENGFGPVVYQEDEVIECIEKNLENNLVVESKYQDRINNFFEFHDKKNKERVMKEIMRLKNE